MAEQEKESGASAQVTTEKKGSLLEAAIKATKQTERSHAEELLKTFAQESDEGQVKFEKNAKHSIANTVKSIEALISKQLAAVMHHPDFQKLEGSWRGLKYLIDNSETGNMLQIKVLNCSKKDLRQDLESASDYDQSMLWKHVVTNEFGQAGGVPFGAIVAITSSRIIQMMSACCETFRQWPLARFAPSSLRPVAKCLALTAGRN